MATLFILSFKVVPMLRENRDKLDEIKKHLGIKELDVHIDEKPK